MCVRTLPVAFQLRCLKANRETITPFFSVPRKEGRMRTSGRSVGAARSRPALLERWSQRACLGLLGTHTRGAAAMLVCVSGCGAAAEDSRDVFEAGD